jgi:hypothetical protein
MGRPTLYSPELLERICAVVAEGIPLARIGFVEGFPKYRTVKDWMDEVGPDGMPTERARHVSASLARAREIGEDMIAAQVLAIADTPHEGVIEKYERVKIENPDDPEGDPVYELQLTERKVEDMLGHRKLQVDARLRLLKVWNPGKFGDKVDMRHEAGESLTSLLTRLGPPPSPGGTLLGKAAQAELDASDEKPPL